MQTKEKRNYDKLRARELYQRFKERRALVMENLGGECFICGEKAIKGFHFHHKHYHEVESNYPRHSNAMNVRIKRLVEAEKFPERFALLCPTHHRLIEIAKVKTFNIDRFKILL